MDRTMDPQPTWLQVTLIQLTKNRTDAVCLESLPVFSLTDVIQVRPQGFWKSLHKFWPKVCDGEAGAGYSRTDETLQVYSGGFSGQILSHKHIKCIAAALGMWTKATYFLTLCWRAVAVNKTSRSRDSGWSGLLCPHTLPLAQKFLLRRKIDNAGSCHPLQGAI